MCFSATASFVVAGVAAAAGVVCLRNLRRPQDLALAAAPFVFSAQQTIEGLQWLALAQAPPAGASASLALTYLILAKAFWPAYAPLAVWLAEPDAKRRLYMLPWMAAGLAVGGHLLLDVLMRPHIATVLNGHIAYLSDYDLTPVVALGYLGATTVPLLLSSHRAVATLGAVVLAAAVLTATVFPSAILSVWCFLAAGASGFLAIHFQTAQAPAPPITAPTA